MMVNSTEGVTLRYCLLMSSGDAPNGRFRCSNGFNLKQVRILRIHEIFQRGSEIIKQIL